MAKVERIQTALISFTGFSLAEEMILLNSKNLLVYRIQSAPKRQFWGPYNERLS